MRSLISLFIYNLRAEYRVFVQSLSILLFSWVVSYVIYRLHPDMAVGEFGFIFWIFMMIIGINICMRVETHHGSEQHLFLYTCVSAETMFLAKFLFNWLYLTVCGILFYGFFIMYFSGEVPFSLGMLLTIVLGAFSLSSCLSFVASMSSYTGGQTTLVSILAIPLLIPIITLLKAATDETVIMDNIEYQPYVTLLSISALLIAVSIILFPFIWKE